MEGRRVFILCFQAEPTPRQENLFRLFCEVGLRPTWITWDRSRKEARTRRRAREEIHTIIRLPAPTESPVLLLLMPRYLRALSRVLREALAEEKTVPVIVATHFFHLSLVGRFPEATWLYDTAEYFAYDLSRYFGPFRSLARPLLVRLEGRMIRRVQLVLAVDSRAGWFERGLRKFNPNVCTVPNVPALADDPSPEKVGRANATRAGRDVVAYVGGILERKGLLVTLDALSHLKPAIPSILLLLIGPYPGAGGKLEELVRERGLEDHVEITGSLPYPEILAQIASAKIGLALHQRIPLYEMVGAFNGRKIFTYMQAGIPILAPNFGEIGRVVTENECGFLVDTANAAEVAHAIRRLLQDEDLRKQLGRNGRHVFEEQYNWEKIATALKHWLITCIKEKGTP